MSVNENQPTIKEGISGDDKICTIEPFKILEVVDHEPPTYTPIYSPTYSPTYVPTYVPTYSPTYVPTYSPTYAPTYVPTYSPTEEEVTPVPAPQPPEGFWEWLRGILEWFFRTFQSR